MSRQFFAELPSDITVDILSRLSVRDVAICKCVCKQWLHLLQTREFVHLHLSKSVPGLVMYEDGGNISVFEFNDERHQLRCIPITNRDCKSSPFIPPSDNYFLSIMGSANGLILLREIDIDLSYHNVLHVCNPITDEYIELPNEIKLEPSYTYQVAYGFGVSKLTGQYKVVSISHELFYKVSIPKLECQVYTLGIGSWRSISPGPILEYNGHSSGIFLNGNLHWLIEDKKKSSSFLISCLDLETEIFSTFSPPPTLPVMDRIRGNLVALMDCLCIYGVSSDDAEAINIWLMKEYGDEKSWNKEFVISEIQIPNFDAGLYDYIYPIKVFVNGDTLMICRNNDLFCYNNKTKTTTQIDVPGLKNAGYVDAMLHTSSFLSLKSLTESPCSGRPVGMMTSNQARDETADEAFEVEQLALGEFYGEF